jgi:hypothetical protein
MLASVGAVQTGQVPQALSSVLQWILAWLSRIADWQAVVFQFVLEQDTVWVMTGKILALLLPAGVLIAGVWGTVLSVGTVPFRLGSTGTLLNSLLMAWWDAGRMCLFYWAGIVRFLVVLLAGIWGVFRLLVGLFWRTLKSAVTSPFALLDATSRQPGVPWIAFTLLLFWSAIEATIFTFTLRPTMAELLADLTGYEVNPFMLVVILWFFLFIVVAGSFASIQVLSDSVKSRQPVQIVLMVVAEVFVAMFEILFLYRELIDAITPWLAQQGYVLGVVGTLVLAFGGWLGVRVMTWLLFGRFGAPALLAILGRQAMAGLSGAPAASGAADTDYWRGPIAALKAEREWFKNEVAEAWALFLLPVLQLLAAGFNFIAVILRGRPHFALPFRSVEDVLAATPFAGRATTEGAR